MGGGILGFDDFLFVAESVHLGLEALLGGGELFLLQFHAGNLLVQPLQFDDGVLLALEGQAGQILPAGLESLPGLAFQPGDVFLDFGGLLLDAPLGGDHFHHAALDILQHFQLLFVGVVQGFPGILRGVEDAVHLGLDDGGHSGKHSHSGYFSF